MPWNDDDSQIFSFLNWADTYNWVYALIKIQYCVFNWTLKPKSTLIQAINELTQDQRLVLNLECLRVSSTGLVRQLIRYNFANRILWVCQMSKISFWSLNKTPRLFMDFVSEVNSAGVSGPNTNKLASCQLHISIFFLLNENLHLWLYKDVFSHSLKPFRHFLQT